MATAAAYFSGIESEIINCLNEAKSSVIVVVAWFKNEKLFSALSRCLHRGVDVHIAINNDEINFAKDGLNFDLLQAHGAKIYLIGGSLKALVHHKFCVIDNDTVISGSYNWTYRANANHENVIIIRNSSTVAKGYTSEFYDLTKSFEKLAAVKNQYVPAVGSIEALVWWDSLSSDWKCVFADKTKVDRFSVRAKQIDEILCITELTLKDNDITAQGLSASGKIDIDNYIPLYALQNLKKLTIVNNNLTSLSFLNSMHSIETLVLQSINLRSFEELSACKSLTSLELWKVGNLDFLPIAKMSLLKSLKLVSINSINFNGIDKCMSLSFLTVFYSKITNFEFITGSTTIRTLFFDKVEVDKINLTTPMLNLKTLKLNGTGQEFMLKMADGLFGVNMIGGLENLHVDSVSKTDDINLISRFKNLKALSIVKTDIDNIKFVQGLDRLETLYLSDIKIVDISPLVELPLLKLFSIYKTILDNVLSVPNYLSNIFKNKEDTISENTKTELLALKAKKPNCVMRYAEGGVEY